MIKESILLKRDVMPLGTSSLYVSNGDYSTWFNALSIKKWLHYTNIDKVSLELNYRGSGKLTIMDSGSPFKEIKLDSTGYINLPIDSIDKRSLLSFKVDKGIEISQGDWLLSSKKEIRDIKCSVVICTFNRHEFLSNTIIELQRTLPENWNVIVVDNGSTPEVESIDDHRFKVIRNPNTGGAGGFTRGIMSAIKDEFTYALFMDDDIQIDGRVLKKTDNFLKSLKIEYHDWFLSGGMLVLDEPTKLHELSARYDGIRVRHNHHNLDLSDFSSIKQTQVIKEHKNHYGAWWYCAIPLKKDMDLPFPFFVNGDDIEFSLRHAPGILTLNGISVWHEAFHLKYNAIKQHYLTVRNSLFINLKHRINPSISLINMVARYFLQRVRGKRYESDLVLLGIEHYLNGPKSLIDIPNPFRMEDPLKGSWFKLFSLLIRFIISYKEQVRTINSYSLSDKLWCGINKHV